MRALPAGAASQKDQILATRKSVTAAADSIDYLTLSADTSMDSFRLLLRGGDKIGNVTIGQVVNAYGLPVDSYTIDANLGTLSISCVHFSMKRWSRARRAACASTDSLSARVFCFCHHIVVCRATA